LRLLLASPVNAHPRQPWVVINGYAQVLTVTVAEIAVCWWALGESLRAWDPSSKYVALGLTVALGAAAFGLYHFAHSPPFDTWPVVGGLTLMGLVSGAFYVAFRDIYGTVVFHNFAGTLGVTNALESSGRLGESEQPMIPVLVTGAAAVVVLILLDVYVVRRRRRALRAGGGCRPRPSG
jgi:hypothetical protein